MIKIIRLATLLTAALFFYLSFDSLWPIDIKSEFPPLAYVKNNNTILLEITQMTDSGEVVRTSSPEDNFNKDLKINPILLPHKNLNFKFDKYTCNYTVTSIETNEWQASLVCKSDLIYIKHVYIFNDNSITSKKYRRILPFKFASTFFIGILGLFIFYLLKKIPLPVTRPAVSS